MLTDEMVEWFETRTQSHIALVRKYAARLGISAEDHDASKFVDPEYTPYVHLTWQYRCTRVGVPYTLSENMLQSVREATFYHIKNNAHHPEFWDTQYHAKTDRPANATDMPLAVLLRAGRGDGAEPMARPVQHPVAEMVADWCAVSEELKNDPVEWADANIGVRWHFTEAQVRYIYRAIDRCFE